MPGWLPASFSRWSSGWRPHRAPGETRGALGTGAPVGDQPQQGNGGQCETLIFVDVDGVLNVGVSIKGEAPINLTRSNCDRALQLEGQQNFHADRILAATRRRLGHGEDATYGKLVSESPQDVSEVLVGRLAELIRTAGEGCTVVLSSSWRKPQHQKRREQLEGRIAAHLGTRSFTFHDSTPLHSESGPEDRLWTVGKYLVDRVRSRQRRPAEVLRVLVLEDFCIHSLRGLAVRRCAASDEHPGLAAADLQPGAGDQAVDFEVDSGRDAERYLLACAAGGAEDVRVKVAHTYDRWISPEGFSMEVGSGLTMEHFCGALSFLGGRCEYCGRTGFGGQRRVLGEDGSEPKAVQGNEACLGREELKCGCEVRSQGDLAGKPGFCIPGQA